jgi:serine/threonine protein kinase
MIAFVQATILGRVDSSNIVQFLESGKSERNDVYWFVTELLVGEALDEYLEIQGPLSEVDAVKVSPSRSLLRGTNGA